MRTIKLFTMLILISLLGVSCSESEVMLPADIETSSKTELVGAHFNLNIIGVKDKTMVDNAAGHVIFVDLYGESKINLVEGDDFAVLDKNGTDEDGALFQLPKPGFEPYVTELPFGFDTTTDYSVYARPRGKPMTGATITTMATLTLLADLIAETEDKKTVRLWDNLVDEYGDALTITWGDFIPNPVTFKRLKGKQTFQNVTAQLLSVVYEIDVTYILVEDNPETPDINEEITETETFHVRIPIFDDLLEGEYWKYENDGLKLLQLRFYPFGTDVTYDDIDNGWN